METTSHTIAIGVHGVNSWLLFPWISLLTAKKKMLGPPLSASARHSLDSTGGPGPGFKLEARVINLCNAYLRPRLGDGFTYVHAIDGQRMRVDGYKLTAAHQQQDP